MTVLVAAGLLVAGIALLVTIRPDWVRHVGTTLAHAHWGWLTAALAAQVFSIGSLARQQRRLLAVGGRLLPLPSVVATTYVGGALSLSLPIVGKAAAAVYSYRRFTARGIQPTTVGWALVTSALYLTLVFLAVSAIGAITTGSPGAITAGILAFAGVIIPAGTILPALRSTRIRHRVDLVVGRLFAGARRLTGRPWRRAERRVRAAIDIAATARVGLRDAFAVVAWSLLNVTATLTAFALSIHAVGGTAPWSAIIITWAAGFGAGQLGLTPGGIGIVDTALTVGLVTAGIPAPTAIAATLVYRIISFWITAVVGSITFALSTRSTQPSQPEADVAIRPTQ